VRSPTKIVRLPGRQIAVEDAGPESGFPVLVHHGGTRHLFPGAVRDAQANGLRLIGYDRPGQGESTVQPGRVVADCAEDVRAILAGLGISRAAVWGSSAGGPYALATAALLPEGVASVCLFASLGPYGQPGLDFAEGMGDGFREEIRVFFEEPDRARADFRAQSAEFAPLASSPAWWMDRWADRAGQDAAHSQEWADYLALVNRDGYAGDGEGWWEDWSASFLPWGFDPATIQAPVALWHGRQDTAAPPAHSRWLAARIPHATAHFPADQDHTNVEEDNRGAAIAWVRSHMK
jgi:pimeloyl-ACP methyl ester carboxylesterase